MLEKETASYTESAIACYFNLVHYVLKRFGPIMAAQRLDYDDLYQVGCIGLLRAVRTYKEDAGRSFKTHAIRLIDHDICSYLDRRGELLKVSARTRQISYRIRRLGMDASPPEMIALRLDCSVKMARNALSYMGLSVSLKGDSANLLARPSYDDQTGVHVKDYIEGLTPTEKRVVALKMQGFTLQDIGKKLGFSKSKAWRSLQSAREELRRSSPVEIGVMNL
ncbi:RNA polymerase sigma-B factor [compost metagenome]